MSSKFFEELAAMKVDEAHPVQTKKLDELSDRADSGIATPEELSELRSIEASLNREMRRIYLHYSVNWLFMSRDQKKILRGELDAWKKKLKGTKVIHDE